MGYHLYSLFYHATAKTRNDFVEMFLHHSVTIALYGFSYYCNITNGGSMIIFLHDIADIFTSGIRCFSETNFKILSIISAIMMLFSWTIRWWAMSGRPRWLDHELRSCHLQPVMSGVAMVKKLREMGRTDFIGRPHFLMCIVDVTDKCS